MNLKFKELEIRCKENAKKCTVSTKKCPKCGGFGQILIHKETGQKCKLSDVPGSQHGDYKLEACTCKVKADMQQIMRNSGIGEENYKSKNFSTFTEDTPEHKKMKDIAMQFIEDKEAKGIGFFGNSGTGKTHICVAICNALLEEGIPHKYFDYVSQVNGLLRMRKFNDPNYLLEMDKWKSCKVLYIDDLFKRTENDYKGNEKVELFFEIINSRYENGKITIFSTEMKGKDLKQLDEAIYSRIVAMCGKYLVGCEGSNKRVDDVKKLLGKRE